MRRRCGRGCGRSGGRVEIERSGDSVGIFRRDRDRVAPEAIGITAIKNAEKIHQEVPSLRQGVRGDRASEVLFECLPG